MTIHYLSLHFLGNFTAVWGPSAIICSPMAAPNDKRPSPPSEWQPEPLRLPVQQPDRSSERSERSQPNEHDAPCKDSEGEDDRPGTHVIVIDIS